MMFTAALEQAESGNHPGPWTGEGGRCHPPPREAVQPEAGRTPALSSTAAREQRRAPEKSDVEESRRVVPFP